VKETRLLRPLHALSTGTLPEGSVYGGDTSVYDSRKFRLTRAESEDLKRAI
jgi:hypothetical protein